MMSHCLLFVVILMHPQFTNSQFGSGSGSGGGYSTNPQPTPKPTPRPSPRPTYQPTPQYCTDRELCSNCADLSCDTGTYNDGTACCFGYSVDYGSSGLDCCKSSCENNACWTNCPFKGGKLAQQLPQTIQSNVINCNTNVLGSTTNGVNADDYTAYYSLQLSDPNLLTFNIQVDSCGSSFDTDLYLFQLDGTFLQNNDDSDSCFNSQQSQLIYSKTGSETFIIKIIGVDDTEFGSYSINAQCTAVNTLSPTNFPSLTPTETPTLSSMSPTLTSLTPTITPTSTPTNYPSLYPTNMPSLTPTNIPSLTPTNIPSINPTNMPSLTPSSTPIIPTSLDETEVEREDGTTLESTLTLGEAGDESSFDTFASTKNSEAWGGYVVAAILFILLLILCFCIVAYKTYKKSNKKIKDKFVVKREIKRETNIVKVKSISDSIIMTEEILNEFEGSPNVVDIDIDALPIDENGYVYNDESDDEICCANTKDLEVQNVEDDEVYVWLSRMIGLTEYHEIFIKNGYGTLEMIKCINKPNELYDLGIILSAHVDTLYEEILKLKVAGDETAGEYIYEDDVSTAESDDHYTTIK